MISILTATYNRAYIITNLFDSLIRQSCHDFEWIVVDDGSSDGSFEKLQSLRDSGTPFPMTVHRQPNRGKHCAINTAVSLAGGNYVFIVDSDDQLTPDAVETVLQWIGSIDSNPRLAGVAGLRGYINNPQRIGDFPALPAGCHYIDAPNTARKKLGLLGDKAEVYRTQLLRDNPFKVFDGENFLPECTVWDEIAFKGYSIRWFDKIIYKCEYLPDGLTKSGDQAFLNNFQGFTYYTRHRIKTHGLVDRMIAIGAYCRLASKKGLSVRQASRNIGQNLIVTAALGFVYKLLK